MRNQKKTSPKFREVNQFSQKNLDLLNVIHLFYADGRASDYIYHLNYLLSEWMMLACRTEFGADPGTMRDMTYHCTRITTFLAQLEDITQWDLHEMLEGGRTES